MIWLQWDKNACKCLFKAKQILRIEEFYMLGRTVHIIFITFLDPLENFPYSICALVHFISQPFNYFPWKTVDSALLERHQTAMWAQTKTATKDSVPYLTGRCSVGSTNTLQIISNSSSNRSDPGQLTHFTFLNQATSCQLQVLHQP